MLGGVLLVLVITALVGTTGRGQQMAIYLLLQLKVGEVVLTKLGLGWHQVVCNLTLGLFRKLCAQHNIPHRKVGSCLHLF